MKQSPGTRNVVLAGTGYFIPERIVTNHDLAATMETSDEFIRLRTGVRTRRHADPGTSLADLAMPAIHQALGDAGLDIEDIDMLIVNTLTPDYHDPSEACYLHGLLGIGKIPAFDIRAQCSGGLFGMEIARQFLLSGSRKSVLVVCAELLSKRIDRSNDGRNLSVLLSDGAAAMVLQISDRTSEGIIDIELAADGSAFDLLRTEAPGSRRDRYLTVEDIQSGAHYFRMRGKEMFAHAVDSLVDIVRKIIARNGLTVRDIDVVVPHQPNLRILEEVARRLDIPMEKFVVTVEELANMASASFPVALSIARERDRLPPSRMALFLTYGSGSTSAAALYRC